MDWNYSAQYKFWEIEKSPFIQEYKVNNTWIAKYETYFNEIPPSGHQVATKWSPSGHQVISKCSPSGLLMVYTSGQLSIEQLNEMSVMAAMQCIKVRLNSLL